MRATVSFGARSSEVELDPTQEVTIDVDGVHVIVSESLSHPGHVIVVVVDATGEDTIWKIPTRSGLALRVRA